MLGLRKWFLYRLCYHFWQMRTRTTSQRKVGKVALVQRGFIDYNGDIAGDIFSNTAAYSNIFTLPELYGSNVKNSSKFVLPFFAAGGFCCFVALSSAIFKILNKYINVT